MAWLDLVVPSAAILALFGTVALVVVAFRQGRAIRRLEERLARSGDAAVDAPLQRIAELQARQRVSEGRRVSSGQMRTAGIVALVAIALVAAIGGIWYLFVKGGDSATATSDTPALAAGASTKPSTTTVAKPVDSTIVPANPPAVADKATYTVAVFNASGISGVARDTIAPRLTNQGWTVGKVDNPPDGETGRKQSVVMYAKGKQDVAQNVAKSLGITRAPPLDGYSSAQTNNADVVVLVGTDIAGG